MKSYIKYYLILLLLFSTDKLSAQWSIMSKEVDSLTLIGREYIYNCEFEKAEELFQQIIKINDSQPVGYFLEVMSYYWKLKVYRFSDYYDKPFLSRVEKVIKICDIILEKNSSDINALFFKGGVLGYRAKFYQENKQWIKSGLDAMEAHKILNLTLKIAPSNHDILLGIGVYNYYTVAIPEKYPLTKPLLSFLTRGDKNIGLLQLEACARHARYSGIEAEVSLLEAYFLFEHNNTASLRIVKDLNKRYPNNPYFHRYLAKTCIRLSEYDKMETIWREILIHHINKKPGYGNITAREALYYIGWALQRRGEYDLALKYLNKCIEASIAIDEDGETPYWVSAQLKIASIYTATKKKKKAIKAYEDILDMDEQQSSHKKAKRYLKKLKNKS